MARDGLKAFAKRRPRVAVIDEKQRAPSATMRSAMALIRRWATTLISMIDPLALPTANRFRHMRETEGKLARRSFDQTLRHPPMASERGSFGRAIEASEGRHGLKGGPCSS